MKIGKILAIGVPLLGLVGIGAHFYNLKRLSDNLEIIFKKFRFISTFADILNRTAEFVNAEIGIGLRNTSNASATLKKLDVKIWLEKPDGTFAYIGQSSAPISPTEIAPNTTTNLEIPLQFPKRDIARTLLSILLKKNNRFKIESRYTVGAITQESTDFTTL